jgi:DNA-binding SARP family transcriptional activator
LGAAAVVAAAVASILAGDAGADRQLADAIDIAERTGLPWLARMGRLASGLVGGSVEADVPRDGGAEGAGPEADPWGALLGFLVDAWVAAPPRDGAGDEATAAEHRVTAAELAAVLARRLGAGVLEAFARGLAAYGMAEAGAPEARDAALAVESLARATGTAGPRLLAYAALVDASSARGAEYGELAASVRRETGLRLPPAAGVTAPLRGVAATEASEPSATPALAAGSEASPVAATAHVNGNGHVTMPVARARLLDIRAFGAFSVEVDGEPVHLDRVKPRARAVLRFLAVRPGVAIHREVIQEALWPDVDGPTGARSLHVAVSALRGLLSEALAVDSTRLIAREGDAYRLAVEPGQVDVGRFERAMARARGARNGGNRAGAGTADFAEALGLYRGDLLPQDGPAEWAVERREHFRREAVEAATMVAEDALAAGDLEEAIRVCRRGLELDRFHDPLWRVLIASREMAGDAGAASRDRREYASILEGLGLGSEVRASSA